MGIWQFVVVNAIGSAPTCSVKTRGFVGRLTHPAKAQPIRIVKRILKAFPNRPSRVLASSTKATVSYSILGKITLHFFGRYYQTMLYCYSYLSRLEKLSRAEA